MRTKLSPSNSFKDFSGIYFQASTNLTENAFLKAFPLLHFQLFSPPNSKVPIDSTFKHCSQPHLFLMFKQKVS